MKNIEPLTKTSLRAEQLTDTPLHGLNDANIILLADACSEQAQRGTKAGGASGCCGQHLGGGLWVAGCD